MGVLFERKGSKGSSTANTTQLRPKRGSKFPRVCHIYLSTFEICYCLWVFRCNNSSGTSRQEGLKSMIAMFTHLGMNNALLS
ncbi:hypothetical protein DEO72_LG5g1069 [Vigna unguiculata]|uniref:Uncharacterized protein n=1 Tax=Vigna unguiculata TaxID=3917 RepID=A0A4D6LVB2_VIGUN|nr:hypothetical protein DEO72_LG5g1069 [Vigna unguiculata]